MRHNGKSIICINNVVKSGVFENGKLKDGLIIFPNNTIYKGKWNNNNFTGEKYLNNGIIYKGIWIKQKFIKGKIYLPGKGSYKYELNNEKVNIELKEF